MKFLLHYILKEIQRQERLAEIRKLERFRNKHVSKVNLSHK